MKTKPNTTLNDIDYILNHVTLHDFENNPQWNNIDLSDIEQIVKKLNDNCHKSEIYGQMGYGKSYTPSPQERTHRIVSCTMSEDKTKIVGLVGFLKKNPIGILAFDLTNLTNSHKFSMRGMGKEGKLTHILTFDIVPIKEIKDTNNIKLI